MQEKGKVATGKMEAKRWSSFILLVVVVLGMWEVNKADAALSAAQCKEERRLGLNACKPVIYGKLPSPACCERVRVSHVECVCPDITPKLAALIDLDRAIRLIEGCGRRVPRHFKCGNGLSELQPELKNSSKLQAFHSAESEALIELYVQFNSKVLLANLAVNINGFVE
ncbi:hypothetical protein D5086_006624 [Populus alba]|uniref:Uncharacterized protein n=1 Tax=Populus alba TaxID=43335 RepID=A0ACC4CLG6_POPAL